MTDLKLPWENVNALFAEHLNEYRKIKSGMHVALLGTTRGGKTTLATGGPTGNGILAHWDDVLVIDSTGDPGFIKDYGKPIQRFGKLKGVQRLSVSDMSSASREKIYKAIQRGIRQGSIAIYADEIRQLVDKKFFNLGPLLDHTWLFTAKRDVSLVGGSQAPRWLPSSFYDQSKTHFIFGMRDRRAMKRLAEISGDVDTLEVVIPNLGRWEFAYVGIDGNVSVSKFAMPKRVKSNPDQSRLHVTRPSASVRTVQISRSRA